MATCTNICQRLLVLLLGAASGLALAQTKAELDAATASALLAQREAEIRKATALAERAALLARLPPSESQAMAGTLSGAPFGAAGLVRAFDLALKLAAEVCAVLPPERKTTLYEPASTQGVVAARLVSDGIGHISGDLAQQNQALQLFIERHSPNVPPLGLGVSLVALAAVPATVRAVADITSLFKSNVAASSIGYGEGARAMFASALAQSCPERLAGLGAGYMGELDRAQYDRLMARVRALAKLRSDYAGRIVMVEQLKDQAKGEQKKELAAMASAAGGVLKIVDAFIDSLEIGDTSDNSPLFNAGRYLGYAARTHNALVLDVDLRLEGMSIIRQNMFIGQHLRLSGVAFLWYRLYEPNGTLRQARALRSISAPVDVDLRGTDIEGSFWSPP